MVMLEKHDRLQSATGLRAFIKDIEAAGELERISGAHWNLEIGALSEVFAEQPSRPALLFDRITDHPDSGRVLTNILNSPLRHSLALGVSPDLCGIPLVQFVKERLTNLKPIAPIDVEEAHV